MSAQSIRNQIWITLVPQRQTRDRERDFEAPEPVADLGALSATGNGASHEDLLFVPWRHRSICPSRTC